MDIVTFLGGSSVVAFLLIGYLKKYIKKFILPRFGDLGVCLILLLISFILASLGYVYEILPSDLTLIIGQIFAGAILIYQVLYKAIYRKALLGKLDKDEV